jgi:hypothetical protein
MRTNERFTRQHSFRVVSALAAALVAAACSKTSTESSNAASSASAPIVLAKPAASASAGGAATGAAGPAAAFAGSYVAKQGVVDSPTKEKTWTEDTASDAVGKGTLELSVGGAGASDGSPRKVIGEAKGPLGPMSITGTFDGKEVRANLAPTQANAPGAMTGFMTLTADGPASLKGTLRVASGNARIVREATVELARK